MRDGCSGTCEFYSLHDTDLNLKCKKCKQTSRGGARGIYYRSKNILYSYILQIAIILGLNYQNVANIFGSIVSKTTKLILLDSLLQENMAKMAESLQDSSIPFHLLDADNYNHEIFCQMEIRDIRGVMRVSQTWNGFVLQIFPSRYNKQGIFRCVYANFQQDRGSCRRLGAHHGRPI